MSSIAQVNNFKSYIVLVILKVANKYSMLHYFLILNISTLSDLTLFFFSDSKS